MGQLTLKDRVILQNLFDTQTARRAQYLKQRGFEMNPDNDNEYRPAGTTEWQEIDPGISYLAKAGWRKALKETGYDVADIGVDMLAQVGQKFGAVMGMSGGVAAGAATGPLAPAMMPILGITGWVVGGGLGNAATEQIKKAIGDIYTSEDIPLGKKDLLVQSVIAGVLPTALGGLTKGGRGAIKQEIAKTISRRLDGLKAVVKQTDGRITDDLIETMVKNPEKFEDPAVIKSAFGHLNKQYQDLFGLSPTDVAPKGDKWDYIPSSSLFGKKRDTLLKEQQAILSRSQKTYTPQELNQQIENLMESALKLPSGKPGVEDAASVDTKAGLAYLREKKKVIEKIGKQYNGQIPLEEVNRIVRSINADAYDREVTGGGLLRQLTGNTPGSLVDHFYNTAGPDGAALKAVNGKLHKLIATYDMARSNLDPNKFLKAFSTNADSRAMEVAKSTFDEIDAELGTGLAQGVKTGQYQALVSNLFKTTPPVGSRNIKRSMAIQAAKRGLTAAVVASPAGPAASAAAGTVGVLGGAAEAALKSTPKDVIPSLIQTAKMATRNPVSPESKLEALTRVAAEAGRREAGLEVGRQVTTGDMTRAPQSFSFDEEFSFGDEERPVQVSNFQFDDDDDE